MQDEAGGRTALAPASGRLLGADPHDFAGLYIRHRSSFTSHARRYLRDPRDADEVVQEAFLRLFLAMPELETELQALAYCRRTITNLCIDRYRADARRPRLVALEGPTVDELAEDEADDPVVRAEDAALVREALSRLPELHRAALVKREIEEKPLPVIAHELDVAEDSVKHLLFRARKALRKLLAGTSVAPGADTELTHGLRPVARGASTGLSGLLLLALLGLGSGPDLRSVPVVGVDLPDVLGVTVVADAVGDAFRGVVRMVVPGRETDDAAVGQAPADRLATRSAPVPGADGPATAADRPAEAGTTGSASTGSSSAGTPGSVAAAEPLPGRPSGVVPGVDGRPVPVLLPTAGQPGGSRPAPTGLQPAVDGRLAGGGLGQDRPIVVLPLPDGAGPARVGGRTVPVNVRPAGGGSGRSPRANDAGTTSADAPVDRADKPGTKTDKAAAKADKAAAKADRAPAGRDGVAAAGAVPGPVQAPAGRASGRSGQAAAPPARPAPAPVAQSAGKGAQPVAKAERAGAKQDRAVQKTTEKAATAVSKAADKTAKAADKAAKAAERAPSVPAAASGGRPAEDPVDAAVAPAAAP